MKKALEIIISMAMIAVLCITPLCVSAYEPEDFVPKSDVALLYSIDTDSVIYSKDADSRRYPASLTKLMTALIVVENCKDMDEKVTIDSDWFAELSGSGMATAELSDGEILTVRQLLGVMLVSSAADAADVLATHIGGSIDKFVKMMNKEAEKLGMNHTHFVNVHGMHDEDHYSTANDLLKLGKKVLEAPIITDLCDYTSIVLPETNKHDSRTFYSTNLMLNGGSEYYYIYTHGLKTGFTTPAGRCLITTASYDGYHYMCIILGGDDYSRSEYTDSRELYRWAFLNFEYRELAATTDQVAEMKVDLSMDTDHVRLFPEKAVAAIIPEDIDSSTIITEFVAAENGESVDAPIKKGQILGYARYICSEQEIARVNLVAGEDIEQSFLLVIKRAAMNIIDTPIFKLLIAALVVMIIIIIIINIIHNKNKRSNIKRVNKIRKY